MVFWFYFVSTLSLFISNTFSWVFKNISTHFVFSDFWEMLNWERLSAVLNFWAIVMHSILLKSFAQEYFTQICTLKNFNQSKNMAPFQQFFSSIVHERTKWVWRRKQRGGTWKPDLKRGGAIKRNCMGLLKRSNHFQFVKEQFCLETKTNLHNWLLFLTDNEADSIGAWRKISVRIDFDDSHTEKKVFFSRFIRVMPCWKGSAKVFSKLFCIILQKKFGKNGFFFNEILFDNKKEILLKILTNNEKISVLWNGVKRWALCADFTSVSSCSGMYQIGQSHPFFVASIFINIHSLANVNRHWVRVFRQKSVKKQITLLYNADTHRAR